jgi:hypothetical protein
LCSSSMRQQSRYSRSRRLMERYILTGGRGMFLNDVQGNALWHVLIFFVSIKIILFQCKLFVMWISTLQHSMSDALVLVLVLRPIILFQARTRKFIATDIDTRNQLSALSISTNSAQSVLRCPWRSRNPFFPASRHNGTFCVLSLTTSAVFLQMVPP